ncbi:hypothetical protein [Falsihalocynthiibacter arcticus]|uniref:Glycerophosphoryl diester phosphodiesterase membrane domain-containing protein n=1 Tax=Falsihalocynthiibacter arcticus TaxID=1579316 RepID=A0A126UXU1_9RHOB|nr:hypothetical protein [Falsihalocynthiibacter arcticus]AML50882.1 hypothetical protein RC74_05950 [Falsihalocynthiibacter arcticus]
MLGWKMFTHSIRMVFSDFKTSLQISGVLYAAVLFVQFFLFRSQFEVVEAGREIVTPSLIPLLAIIIISVVASLWIAVSWHRYVLLGENGGVMLPPFRGRDMLGYLWRSVLIGLTVLVVALFLLFIMTAISLVLRPFLSSVGPRGLAFLSVILFTPAFAVFYRLSPVLPAAALGKSLTLREAWIATKDMRGAILTLAFLTMAISGALQLLASLILPAGLVSLMFQNAVLGWVSMMVGVSMLTTVYGMAIEGRELP